MDTQLRQDVDEVVTERVMRAVATLVRRGVDDLTFARTAAESGVAERTLYRRYPTKAALLEGFWHWLNKKIDAPAAPQSAAELIEQIPSLYAAFEADEALVRAMLHDRNGREVRLAQADARRKRLRMALKDVLAPLGAKEREHLLASVQLIASAAGWESMKDNWGLSGKAAGEAAQWAVMSLIDAARQTRTRRS